MTKLIVEDCEFCEFDDFQGWVTHPTSSPELDLPKEAALTEWGIAKNLPNIFPANPCLDLLHSCESSAPTVQANLDGCGNVSRILGR